LPLATVEEVDGAAASEAVPTSTRTTGGCLRRFLFLVASEMDVVAAVDVDGEATLAALASAAEIDGEATAVVVVSSAVDESMSWSAADDVDATSVTSASSASTTVTAT